MYPVCYCIYTQLALFKNVFANQPAAFSKCPEETSGDFEEAAHCGRESAPPTR